MGNPLGSYTVFALTSSFVLFAGVILAVVCLKGAPSPREGLQRLLLLASCVVTGASAGGVVALLARRALVTAAGYAPPFLGSVAGGLVFAAIYAFRPR